MADWADPVVRGDHVHGRDGARGVDFVYELDESVDGHIATHNDFVPARRSVARALRRAAAGDRALDRADGDDRDIHLVARYSGPLRNQLARPAGRRGDDPAD